MNGTAAKVLEKLQAFKLKEEGNNQYRCNSPFRPGSNSHAFHLTIHDDEYGAYIDHARDGERGSLYELAAKLGVEIPQKISIATTKRAYAGLSDYARAHGVPDETLGLSGWKEVDYQGRPALEFLTDTGKRWRFLDGEKPHYKSASNYQRCWYGLKAATMSKILHGQPLIICNGEISVITAHHHNLAAAAITSGEKEAIPLPLFKQLLEFLDDACEPLVLIALDCDPAGQRAALGIKQQLLDANYTRVRAVDLKLGKGGDLSDFCMLHQDNTLPALEALPDLEAGPEISEFYSWNIIHADELHKLPKVEWIIPGEIQTMGLNVIFGASGVGKSFLALHYALRIAQNEPVVYMAGEGVYGYNKRIGAWEKHHHQNRSKLYICTGAVSLLDNDEFHAFLQSIKHIRPKLVVVDTLARSMIGGDENSTRDMGLFIRACDLIRNTLGCAVLLIHHTDKSKQYERGSYALRGAADVMIRVSDEGDVLIVEMEKVKDDNPLPLRYYKLLPVPLDDGQSSMVFVEAEKIVQTASDLLSPNQQKIMRLLADVYKEGATAKEVADETRIPHSSVKRDLGQMKQLGFVEQGDRGQPYAITEAGQLALNRTLQTGKGSMDQLDQQDQWDHDPANSDDTDPIDPSDPTDPLIHPLPMFGESHPRSSQYRRGA